MLIRTTKELKQLPIEAVLLSTRRNKKYGHHYLIYLVSDELATIDGVFHSLTKKELGKYLPARLIHPRRYGDEDFRRAGKAAKDAWQMTACTGDNCVTWPSVARAALKALESDTHE